MTMGSRTPLAAALLLLLLLPATTTTFAKNPLPSPAADTVVVAEGTALLPRVEKRHVGKFNGQTVNFRSVVQETPVTDAVGTVIATIGSISYIREGADERRPVIFAFNGGPGSASIWLHMGYLGPMRVDYGSTASDDEVRPSTAAPFAMVANPESPLDVADIVLIDPPGTGYARVHGAGNTGKVFGVQQDAQAVVQFIGNWLRQHNRSNSPKYLMGESYGTVRAAEVARLLAGGPFATGRMDGITLNGVMLLGQAMDGTRRSPENSALNGLLTYAATAWHHGKVPRTQTLGQHVQRAREFGASRYITALFAGSRLSTQERQAIADELSSLIGIPSKRLLELSMRMDTGTFGKELLLQEGLQVGAYDARFTLPLSASGNDPVADDPAMGQYVPLYVGAMQKHLRENLGVTTDRAYNPIEFTRINFEFQRAAPSVTPNYAASLATAMRRNPQLRVLVGTGYFDLTTTLGAAEQAVALSGMDASRVTMIEYASGHMPYIGKQSRAQLAKDVRAFVKSP